MTDNWYGKSVAEIYKSLQMEGNTLWNLVVSEDFTRERILWLLMQK